MIDVGNCRMANGEVIRIIDQSWDREIRKVRPAIVHVPWHGGVQRVSCPLPPFFSPFWSFSGIRRILRRPRLITPYQSSVGINWSSRRRCRTRDLLLYGGAALILRPLLVQANSSSSVSDARSLAPRVRLCGSYRANWSSPLFITRQSRWLVAPD